MGAATPIRVPNVGLIGHQFCGPPYWTPNKRPGDVGPALALRPNTRPALLTEASTASSCSRTTVRPYLEETLHPARAPKSTSMPTAELKNVAPDCKTARGLKPMTAPFGTSDVPPALNEATTLDATPT